MKRSENNQYIPHLQENAENFSKKTSSKKLSFEQALKRTQEKYSEIIKRLGDN